jgi:hypothetical protein
MSGKPSPARSLTRAKWAAPTSTDIAYRRAAGRRRYNSVRKLRADLRAVQIFRRLVECEFARGAQRKIAAEFGVSQSTVSRAMDRLPRPPGQLRCPLCGALRLDPDLEDQVVQGSHSLEARIERQFEALGPKKGE